MDVLILAGGEARRLGGADKPMLEIGGRTLLDRVIEAVHEALRDHANAAEIAAAHAEAADVTVIVGPERPTRHPVMWVREDPPGGGPVAAIAAGLAACRGEYVGVFAADLPFLTAETIHSLWTAIADSTDPSEFRYDAAVAVDEDGREQWLAAVYRRDALLAKITDQGADNLPGLPLRRLVKDLRLLRIAPPGQSVRDVDTWEDVAAVRQMIAGPSGDHARGDHAHSAQPEDERD